MTDLSPEKLEALQREYPASWRSMLPAGMKIPDDQGAPNASTEADFPNSPGMRKPEPSIAPEKLEALQRDYPASWRSMLPTGVKIPGESR